MVSFEQIASMKPNDLWKIGKVKSEKASGINLKRTKFSESDDDDNEDTVNDANVKRKKSYKLRKLEG